MMKRTQALVFLLVIFFSTFSNSQGQKKKVDRKQTRVELAVVLKSFLVKEGEGDYPRWEIGTGDSNLPIRWKTNGVVYVEGNNSEVPYSENFPRYREASGYFSVNGQYPWLLGRNGRSPLPWKVYLLGDKVPMCLSVSMPEETFGSVNSGADFTITPPLTSAGFRILRKTEKGSPHTGLYETLKIKATGFDPVWIVQAFSCGSGGCTTDLSLFWREEDVLTGD
jgi:hypothetical protein